MKDYQGHTDRAVVSYQSTFLDGFELEPVQVHLLPKIVVTFCSRGWIRLVREATFPTRRISASWFASAFRFAASQLLNAPTAVSATESLVRDSQTLSQPLLSIILPLVGCLRATCSFGLFYFVLVLSRSVSCFSFVYLYFFFPSSY